ncbi:MAG: hypothetical protein MAG453_01874 [Calditrichaeota bacterium]|nr:hypothetical protein [Calditrichota bacterium]
MNRVKSHPAASSRVLLGESLRWLARGARAVAEIPWPSSCIVCGSHRDLGRELVCEACWRRLLPASTIEKPKPIDRLAVAFAYDDTMRAIVHRFKFDQAPSMARALAWRMLRRLEEMGFVFFDSILLPAPAHPARRRERGYNPAARLARELARELDLPCRPRFAKRLLHGPHQSSLPDHARERALRDAFAVRPPPRNLPETTRLVLVDDVVHTGRTLGQLARSARKAGWGKIDALCLSA